MKPVLFLLLFTTFSFAQKYSKKEYYFDENKQSVSKVEFLKKINNRYNIDNLTYNDTAIIGTLHIREKIDKLNTQTLKQLRQFLTEIKGTITDTSKVIIINYWSGLDHKCTSSQEYEDAVLEEYITKLDRITKTEQYWIYKDYNDLQTVRNKNLPWLQDKGNFIETTFFPYHFNYGSFIIIHPNGNYYRYFGEHGKDLILKNLKRLIRKNED